MLFVIVSVIYRPIEQLLSRTIADRRARGFEHDHPLRTPLILQASFALAFLVVALALRGPIQDDLFDGSATLYWILVVARARLRRELLRARLAGRPPVVRPLRRARVPGGDLALLFALAVAVGIAAGADGGRARHGGGAARLAGRRAVGVLAPAARAGASSARRRTSSASARGGRFALAVLAVMVAEQTLLNAAVLPVDATAADAAVAGFVFNVLLIARAPLQLFQAIQGSLLPHLAGLEAREGRRGVRRAIRVTILAIARLRGRRRARAAADRAVGDGPAVRRLDFTYGRWGLALVALGMGAHLVAGTLNQAALARDRAGTAAAVLARDRRRRSSPGWSARWSTTSCCAPRSATAARRCCWSRCWRSCTAQLGERQRRLGRRALREAAEGSHS